MGASRNQEYRPDIDGLRAVAILGVVAFHVGGFHIRGGFTGVDVFFVISGFLITGLLLNEQQITGRIDLINFYARRARRLIPALTVVLLAVAALGALILRPTGELQSLGAATIAAAGFVANLRTWRNNESYFARGSDHQPHMHTWTLSVEEQFYIGFPLLLLVAGWIAHRTGRRAHLPLMWAAFAVSFLLCLALSRWRDVAAFYLSPPAPGSSPPAPFWPVAPGVRRPAPAAGWPPRAWPSSP